MAPTMLIGPALAEILTLEKGEIMFGFIKRADTARMAHVWMPATGFSRLTGTGDTPV